MASNKWLYSAAIALALGGCLSDHDGDTFDDAEAYIGASGVIPNDAQCTHITATRLADFHVSTYQGPLAGGSFKVGSGETRVTATAFPPPCSQEPVDPPWIADEQ